MGMKNTPKIMGQLLIDLTPLLDVIFILLLVVLTYESDFDKNAKNEMADAQQIRQEATAREQQVRLEANDAIAEAEGKRDAAQEQLDTYEHLYDSVNVVTIYASYKPSNRKFRTVHVQINAEKMWEKEINPSNEDNVWKDCQVYIETEIANNGNNPIPTLFSVTNEKMLYRDEQSILSLYEKLNIQDKYLKNYTETDDE